MIKIGLNPYLSPIRPQIGDMKKAVTNVTPKIKPDQRWTYSALKSPNVLIYNERKGNTIVILAAIIKLQIHMIHKLRFSILIITPSHCYLFRVSKYSILKLLKYST